jgi:ABC-2 type transport system ATP-binding protein
MERLIDDVLIMDYNRVLAQCPVNEFMTRFKRFDFELEDDRVNLKNEKFVANLEKVKNKVELYCYESKEFVKHFLDSNGVAYKGFEEVKMKLEDAFIGLTGKY